MRKPRTIKTLLVIALALTFAILSSTQFISQSSESNSKAVSSNVVLQRDLVWEPLNPARGEKSPKAANLWGDRTEPGASGFLVQFLEGFASPPHIHNVTYRGVVINGLIHNDDPGSENMWLPRGSFWTQPAGGNHITSASGSSNLAYIEIEEGPYFVLPTEEAFDSGEKPINIDPSNLIWLDSSNINWIDQSGALGSEEKPKLTFLWGTPEEGQLNGTLIKLPVGFSGNLRIHGTALRAVVIQGKLRYHLQQDRDTISLEPGSYFGSDKEMIHLSCDTTEECFVYLRTEGKYDLIPS